MDMIPVSSSAISAIGYDRATKRMRIEFSEGKTYTFCRVPESVFAGFLESGSKGTYYSDHIRGRYHC